MTHRTDGRRWQEYPERRVSQTQLNRVKRAANSGKTQPATERNESDRKARDTRKIQ